MPDAVPDAMRRAFTQVRNGRPRPALVEIPADVYQEEVPEPLDYRSLRARGSPRTRTRSTRPRASWWRRSGR